MLLRVRRKRWKSGKPRVGRQYKHSRDRLQTESVRCFREENGLLAQISICAECAAGVDLNFSSAELPGCSLASSYPTATWEAP